MQAHHKTALRESTPSAEDLAPLEAKKSTKRFGELKKSIGTVSQKVLTAQLRDMEEKGLLTRKVYAEVPPRVEYILTATGYSLKPVLDAMSAWGADYKMKNG